MLLSFTYGIDTGRCCDITNMIGSHACVLPRMGSVNGPNVQPSRGALYRNRGGRRKWEEVFEPLIGRGWNSRGIAGELKRSSNQHHHI